MRRFLITATRCLVTGLGAVATATAAAMLGSQLVTVWYRAQYHLAAGVDLIEDYRYVTYHTLIVLPLFVAVLVVAGRYIWRWSTRFQRTTPS